MNTRESVSRTLKAAKLMWALEAQARRVGICATTTAACNELGELANRLSDAEWHILAAHAGVRPPSEETRVLVLLLLKAKAQWLFEQPAVKSVRYSVAGWEVANG